jgi:DnaJ-class molecular chaperone
MSWLSRLFGRESDVNPEGYERVRCDICHGTGARISGPVDDQHVMTHKCWKCHGKGWLAVKQAE